MKFSVLELASSSAVGDTGDKYQHDQTSEYIQLKKILTQLQENMFKLFKPVHSSKCGLNSRPFLIY